MKTIGKTIILNERESMYKGKCTTDIVNKSKNIISIHRESGIITFLKVSKSELKGVLAVTPNEVQK